MKKYLIILLFLSSSNVYGDCRVCCDGHGGIICADGITRCFDGTAF